SGGGTLPIEDPATGETLVEVADAQPDDALAALGAAATAQAEWAAHPPRERGEILRRAFEALIARADELELLMTLEVGQAVMEPLIRDSRARKLSFTGSTEVGRKLMEQASEQLLRLSMELGGNAPFLVFDDADLDAAVEGALIAKMRNVGEACTAANRFHVAAPVAEEFAAKLAGRMGAMKVGRGTEPDVKVGTLIDDAQRGKVDELVDNAVG